VTLDLAALAAGTLVVPADAGDAVAFAADELAAYLGRLFGRVPERRTAPAPPGGAWLGLGAAGPAPALAAGSEYAVHARENGAVLVGRRPRALLAAVYALLESAGCRWSPDGREEIPGPGRARPRVSPLEVRPAFARRVWAADLATWHYTVPDRLAARMPADVAFVDWMAKTGATGLLFIRHANDTQWHVPELAPELRRRDLAIEGGGHALVELMPRELFALHPEYFPLGATGRSDLGNVCVSSPGALAVVRECARAARAALPDAPDLHLWGLDLFGGGWCGCDGCAALTPSDQSLTVCNAAADTVGDDGRIFHLAYHDTLAPPASVRPHPRVWAEFAPRERCYAHAIDDAACTTNARYRAALEAHVACFDGRVDVFEYYGDAILFAGCAVPLAAVVARDLAYYRAAGVQGVSCLVFGRYSLWAYGLNVETFARGAVSPDLAPAVREAYSARRYGPAAAPMARYLDALARLTAAAVTNGDVLLPPDDVERAETVRLGLDAALREAPALRRLLAAATAVCPSDAIAAEERLLDYTLAVLAAVRDWLGVRADTAAAERAIAAVLAAGQDVRVLEVAGTWGTYDLEITHHFFAGALRARKR
jgi:Domain of unknown function (DUF4838)